MKIEEITITQRIKDYFYFNQKPISCEELIEALDAPKDLVLECLHRLEDDGWIRRVKGLNSDNTQYFIIMIKETFEDQHWNPNPVKVQKIYELAKRKLRFSDIWHQSGYSKETVAKYLKVLYTAGMIARQDGRYWAIAPLRLKDLPDVYTKSKKWEQLSHRGYE